MMKLKAENNIEVQEIINTLSEIIILSNKVIKLFKDKEDQKLIEEFKIFQLSISSKNYFVEEEEYVGGCRILPKIEYEVRN